MMDVFEAIERRQSIRRYKKNPVPEQDLERIMDSARRAPSGSNLQPWRFIIVREEVTRQALRQIAKYNQWVEEAPVVIEPWASWISTRRCRKDYRNGWRKRGWMNGWPGATPRMRSGSFPGFRRKPCTATFAIMWLYPWHISP